ncbi:MAG: hypothetical protein IKA61_07005 [Clostridia bacterium]|nr:hypothetical protein [Clostridia bacterium]
MASSYLHIGDSYACDIEPSAGLDIDSFRLMTSAEIYKGAGNTPSKDFGERKRQAEHISIEYNSPFSKI